MSLWQGKLPAGWSRKIPNHCEIVGRYKSRGFGPKLWKSPEYHSWYCMVCRCYMPSAGLYYKTSMYQEEGILVCSRWIEGDGKKHGFLCFLEDMNKRKKGMTLDRINSSGHYTLDNCCWSSATEQARNRRKKAA